MGSQVKRHIFAWLGSVLVIAALISAAANVARQVNAHPKRTAIAPASVATAGNCSRWHVVNGSNPGSTLNILSSVAAVSASDVWAVGTANITSPGVSNTLVEHWTGSIWNVVSSPSPGAFANWLQGIAALAANNVWAVGWSQATSGGLESTLIEHWNGSAWSVVPSPNGPDVTSSSALADVSAVSASDVWAVGTNGTAIPLVEHWNGSAWSVVTVPAPGNFENQLTSVVAVSSTNVWVAGFYRNTNSSQIDVPLFDHFDGTNWSQIAGSNPNWQTIDVQNLAAVSSTDIWAVGYGGVPGNPTSQSFTEHWDGTSWTVVSSPQVNGLPTFLLDVAAVAANDVFAVGTYAAPAPIYRETVIMEWNGTRWQIVNTPNLGAYSTLNGISAVPGRNVWAVGELVSNHGYVVIEHYNPFQMMIACMHI